MKIYSDIKSEEFNYEIVPYLIIKVITKIYNVSVYKGICKNMDNYLKENYKLTIKEIIGHLRECIKVSKENNKYLIQIDPNKIIKGYRVELLLRLIDYGNSSVKGINLIKRAEEYIKPKLGVFYMFYKKGGFSNVN